jgi:nucleoid-associated protein YgaU
MGLFGKSDKEKEAEEQAAHHEAQRKMQEALRRREQEEAARKAAKPAAAPAGAAAAPAAAKPAAVPTAAPAAAAGETYTVQKGDSLSKIAKKHLGDANAWKKIYDANKAVIGDDPDKIFPGQKLTLPGGSGTRNA